MVDNASFRSAMARFASSVTLVTSDGEAGLAGVTATSVTSVSDEPPIVLACLNLNGRASSAIRRNRVFCVNLLAPAHKGLAIAFSGRGQLALAERFALAGWHRLASGAPVLDGCVAALDCELHDERIIGTHAVLFGRVMAISCGEDYPPLLYSQRAYRRLERWPDDEA